MENMNSSSTPDERARKEKGKSALLDMYAARKDVLDKLESNAGKQKASFHFLIK